MKKRLSFSKTFLHVFIYCATMPPAFAFDTWWHAECTRKAMTGNGFSADARLATQFSNYPPKRPVRETDYYGILSYVPVHGGITFVSEDEGAVMYGFDTVHYNSHEFPRTDIKWIKGQITVMLRGIQKAAEVEKKYLTCTTNKGKAKWAQMVQDIQPEQSKNFGVMINLLSGKL